MRVLVVGATGILAPAVRALAVRGDEVTGIARHEHPGMIAVDARDAAALSIAIGDRTWDAAVVYGPAVTAVSSRMVRSVTSGPVVRVLTSDAAAPGRPDPTGTDPTGTDPTGTDPTSTDPARSDQTAPSDVLLLGWAHDGDRSRWHTPEEVSSAALAVLDSGESAVLGVVRPWAERPGPG